MKKLLQEFRFLNFFILICLFAVGTVSAQKTWDGGAGTTNWGDGANWNPNGVPTAGQTVTIANNNDVTVNVNAVCASFTISNGNARNLITISGTNSLTVSGAVTIGAGNGNNDDKLIEVGAGSLNCASITTTATGGGNRDSGITLSSGTVTVTGNVSLADATCIITFTGAGELRIGGNLSGGGTFTRSTGTVEFYGDGTGGTSANQSIGNYTYYNLNTLGSGTKSLIGNTIINGGSLNIGSGTTLDLLGFTANRSGSGGTLTVAGTMLLGGTTGGQTGSNFPLNFGTMTMTGGTVDYDNLAGGQTIYSGVNYATLTLNNTSGTQTAGGNITATTVNNNIGGTLNMGTNVLSLTNITNAGIIRTQNTSANPIPAGKTWGGTVQFDGAGQSVPGAGTTFNNLIYAGSGTKTLTGGAMTVSNDFTINSGVVSNLGTFTSSANKLYLGGTGQPSGSHGGNTSGATYINTTYFATATGRLNVATCSQVGYWSGATSTDWATASNWCDGTVPTASTNIIINSGGNQPVISSAAVCNAITLGNGASLTVNSTLGVSGNWTNNGATVSGTGTVNLGTSVIGGSASTTFPNLTTTGTVSQTINTNVSGNFSKTGGTYSVSSSGTGYTLAVTGNFSNSGGTFYVSNGANNSTLTVGGTFGLSAGTFILGNNAASTATVNVAGASTVSGNGVIIIDNVGSPNALTFNAADFTTSGTGGSSNDGGRSNCSIDFGLGTTVNHSQIRISGNFVHSSTNVYYTSSSTQVGSIVFNGTGTQTFSYSGTNSQYTCITVNSGSTVQLLSNFTFGNSTSFTPASTFLVNGTLDAQTFQLGGSNGAGEIFTLGSGGTLMTANTNGVVSGANGTISTSMGGRNFNAAANYIFDGSANQNTGFNGITTMNNLTIANVGSSGSNTVTITVTAPTVNGTLAVNSGNLDSAAFQIIGNNSNNFTMANATTFRMSGANAANFPTLFNNARCIFNVGSTVEYYGATQTVSAVPNYGNLTITTAGTKTAGGALTVAGNLTINTGATFAASTFTHNVAGNWTNSGTFTANTSTINLNGAAQNISGSASTFNNLILSNASSTKTFGVATPVSGNLNINTGVVANLGTFTHSAATLTMGGFGSPNGSHGSTTSAATHKNNTFFAATTGIINVATPTCAAISAVLSGTTAICTGNSANLSAAITGGLSPYTVITSAGTVNNYVSGTNVPVSPTSTITYSLTSVRDVNGCTAGSLSGTPTVTVNTLSVAPTGITGTTTICNGGSTTLTLSGGTAGTGATAQWFSGSCGGTPVGTGNSISVSPTSSTTYYVRYSGTCNTTTCASQLVTVNTLSVAPTGITGTTTICNGGSTTLTLSGGTAGTGATAEWFAGSCGGTPIGTGNSILVSPTSNTTYYVRYNGTCNTTTCASQLVTVNTPSVAPTSITGTTTICEGTSTTLTAAGGSLGTGAIIEWYVLGCNTVPAGTGPSITVSPTSNTTYYVHYNGACNTTTCASQLITVNPRATASVISGSAAICSGTTTNIQVAITGGTSPYTVVYSAGTVGSYVSGTNIPVAPTSSTTYTLTSVTDANGCVGVGNSGSAAVTIDSTTSTNGGPWSNGSPSASKSAIFDGTSVTLGTDFEACSLTLRNSSVVTVQSGTDVDLSGAITVEAGSTFTLENNANLLQTIPSGTSYVNSGNIIVKRNSSALKRFDYTLWSSPVAGQGIYAFSNLTLGNRFYAYRTNTNVYNNADLGFNLSGLDANNVNGTDLNNVQFAQAKGYLIRMPWNHPTAPAIWNGTFTGVPHNGDISFTMTNGGAGQQFNLVGNPYPSPIDMTQFVYDNTTTNANITGTLYFWRETNNNTSNNAYCSWAGGTFTSNGEAQVFNPNGIIRTGQGFFVEADGAATTVNFRNEQRSSDNGNHFFKNNNVTNDIVETNRFWLNLTNTSGAFSQMAAGYMTNATNGVDIYDGKNINTGSVLLNSILDNKDYTIQGKSLPFDSADVIPLSYKITTAGSYTIAIDHVDGLFTNANQPIYLKDNLTSTEHNLQTGAYNFASDAGTFTNRFEIVYQSQLSNPVFTANSVIVYSQDNDFVIHSGNAVMASVKVFDIRGRLLQEKTGINSNQTTIGGGLANQVLLIQITSDTGVVVTKKVIR